jgi:glycosyltransferase involved in cell wall biosynthesis
LRIGFDVAPLDRPHPPGVVRATRGLVTALERRGRIEVVRLTPPPRARIATWRQFELPRARRTLGLRGIHSPLSAFPLLSGGARVQTIHETPWVHGEDENADALHRLWASVGPLRADAVLCPSAATADAVRAGSPLAAHKVHACAWGVDPIFTASPQAHDDEILERFSLRDRPYVLAPGAVRAKKNLTAVLGGVQHAAEDLVLVVTGPLTPHLLASVARFPAVAVRMPGDVDDRTLSALVRRAAAVAVLSTSEGFALPVIEAQSCGAPVVVSAGSTQAQTAGTAAFHVDPADEHEVAAALGRAIEHRARFAAAGFENAAQFTWDRCAEQVERVWEAIA